MSLGAMADTWTCSPVGMSINPTFMLDVYNGASFKKVVNTLKADAPFVATVIETASDTITYEFPAVIAEEDGYIGMTVKTLGMQTAECEAGKDANLIYKDLTGEVSLVPYCCK